MRIAYAIPVNHMEPLQTGLLMATGIESTRHFVREFPAIIRPHAIVCAKCSHAEADEQAEHTVSVAILGPSFEELMPRQSINFTASPPADGLTGWDVKSLIPLRLQFVAEVEGTYSIEISLDGGASESIPLLVRRR